MGIFDKVWSVFKGETEEAAELEEVVVARTVAPVPARPVEPLAAPEARRSEIGMLLPAGERRSRPRKNARPGTKVLIIDDSPTVVFAFKKILKSVGHVTFEALDAEAGLELARAEAPELIFLDIVLPGMNGFAALRQIRRDPLLRDIPVIMISSNEQATEQFFGSKIGADDFMKKPFGRMEVFARIANLLDANKMPRRLNATPPPAMAATPATPVSAPAAVARQPALNVPPAPAAVAPAPALGVPISVPLAAAAAQQDPDSALARVQQEMAIARAAAEKSARETAELRDKIAALESSIARSTRP